MAAIFFITPLMRHSLTDAGYGSWLLAMNVIGYFLLLDAGVTFTSARFFAVAVGSGDNRKQGIIAHEARRILRFISAAIFTCTVAALPLMPWIASSQFSALEVSSPLAICGTITAIRFAFRMPLVLLRAHVRYDLLAYASILRTVAQTGIMAWMLLSDHGLIGAAIAHGSGELLELFLQSWFVKSVPRSNTSNQSTEETTEIRKSLFKYSNAVLMFNVGDILRLQATPLLISRMFGVSQVPVYSIGLRLITMLEDLINALFGGQVLSGFSQLHGAGKHPELVYKFRRVTRLTSCFAACAIAGMVIIGKPFIIRWMGQDFEQAHEIMLILAVPYALRFMQYPSHSLLYAVGMPYICLWVNLIGGFISLLLSLTLAPIFGLHGVVMGTFFEMLIVYLFVMPWMVTRITQINPVIHLFLDIIWPGTKALVFPLFFAWLLADWLQPRYDFLSFFSLGYAVTFAITAPWISFDKSERRTLWATITSILRL
ncbi:MAG: oligosaccharide flippase family protein [Verrucomicrobiaceae bacterium]|nr:oligosaccharide flippase family protein [Verrucomicrobiaceae bacterium]